MNCKPGDLAIVVLSLTGREGAIVEVIEATEFQSKPAWIISYRGSTKHPDADASCVAFDSQLRPLRGDLLDDEITSSKELEAA